MQGSARGNDGSNPSSSVYSVCYRGRETEYRCIERVRPGSDFLLMIPAKFIPQLTARLIKENSRIGDLVFGDVDKFVGRRLDRVKFKPRRSRKLLSYGPL